MSLEHPRLVALALPSGPAFVVALHDVLDAGDAVLPLDPGAPAAVTDAILARLRPDVLVEADGSRTTLPDPLPTPPGTGAVIVTSGSTGAPKGATLPGAALAASWTGTAARLDVAPADRWLACLPVHHIAGLSILWRSRLAGTDPVALQGFDVAAVADAIPDVDLVSFVPTQLRRVLDAGVDLSGLRAVLLGGARADADLLTRARELGVPVVTTYGMSETCGGCVYDGVPLGGVEVRVDADGIIGLRGAVRFSAYRGDPALTAEVLDDEGWFTTADLGVIEADGRLRVLGRADDVIVTGGEKVIAGEVERIVAALPSVAEAAVVGRADPEWGERVIAAVIPADAMTPPDLGVVRDAVRAVLGAAAAPKELLVLADLPRLATGKVDRMALRGDSS